MMNNDQLTDEEIESADINDSNLFAKISAKLSEKSKEVSKLNNEIFVLENKLAENKKLLCRILEDEMPALMDEINVSSVTLSTGEIIEIDPSLHASIKAENKNEAHNWLTDNGHADLIKKIISINFNRGETNMVGEITSLAEKLGLNYNEKSDVHSQTLKAWVKEQMKLGQQLPQDLFGIFIRRVVKIKERK